MLKWAAVKGAQFYAYYDPLYHRDPDQSAVLFAFHNCNYRHPHLHHI